MGGSPSVLESEILPCGRRGVSRLLWPLPYRPTGAYLGNRVRLTKAKHKVLWNAIWAPSSPSWRKWWRRVDRGTWQQENWTGHNWLLFQNFPQDVSAPRVNEECREDMPFIWSLVLQDSRLSPCWELQVCKNECKLGPGTKCSFLCIWSILGHFFG